MVAVDTNSESVLVDRAVAGDADAFARLYDLHVTNVYQYVYFRVGNRPDAEDITQQVFLNAWRSIRAYHRSDIPFGHWLIRIAHNQAVSALRRRRPTTTLDYEPAGPASEHVDTLVAQRAAADEVRQALTGLDDTQQQAVTLRFVADLSYAEIGRVLGKSEGNMRVVVHRALQRLRRRLCPEGSAS